MANDVTPVQRAIVNVCVVLICAAVCAGIAWAWPVIDGLPLDGEDSVRTVQEKEQAVRNLQKDNGSQKLGRAIAGAMVGTVLGVGYCVFQRNRGP